MSNPIADMIAVAKREVGYREGRNNYQKYSPGVPGLEWSQNQPWCATFLCWVAGHTPLTPTINGHESLRDFYPVTASVPAAHHWAVEKKQWSEYPAVGAWVVIGTDDHIGLVVDYDSDYITTVEGNTNDNGSANGNGVYLRRRFRRSASVLGYLYPKIPGVTLRSADPKYVAPGAPFTIVEGDVVKRGQFSYPLVPGQTVKVKA